VVEAQPSPQRPPEDIAALEMVHYTIRTRNEREDNSLDSGRVISLPIAFGSEILRGICHQHLHPAIDTYHDIPENFITVWVWIISRNPLVLDALHPKWVSGYCCSVSQGLVAISGTCNESYGAKEYERHDDSNTLIEHDR
jgi:hypothetical protein